MKIKLGQLFVAREERLPRKTGLGGKIRAMSPGPLFNPKITIATNRALKRNLADSSVTDSKMIRSKSMETLNRAAYTINSHLQSSQKFRGIRFSVDQDSGKTVVNIRDTKTGEVMRSLPNETAIAISGNLRLLSGLIMDKDG